MKNWFIFTLFVVIISGCSSETTTQEEDYIPIPYQLEIPTLFAEKLIDPRIPINNKLTVEGVTLGKRLFFDNILSVDGTKACASCHLPQNAFSDPNQFSQGVTTTLGTRNSMPLFNLAWNFDDKYFWDGHALGLENQALEPVIDTNELGNDSWEPVEAKLNNHEQYPKLFEQAFGTSVITKQLVAKAIAQFERTLISGNSKFDKFSNGEIALTPQEQNGLNIFMSEDKGDCFHCHGNPNNPLWTDNQFHNNGLDATFSDLGLGLISGNPNDNGKFRSPSLRNLAYTAPYMHDGRFATLEEVIEHYSTGLQDSDTIDTLMKKVNQGGVQLTTEDKADLKAFLLTLSDPTFINNPDFIQQ
ncbi:cytochrome-c peroxidase [Olleya sp. YSTF-M6]|uniref:Cytochrome-c peroxidase n=1 Tax=Olleya sediminilitoris TaxID=2795739 RepID=A0ABS1WNE3_9FLAO|nr:cytochrome c peroxidase [Olleya sediminilitoris]MBL7560652.1 cytochrome-c peroxidase [Olleya sediminilitoris]